ncbi:hypothetical protein LO772_08405 [Yinghuangia sp. ASG 101]|uniref:hypothetical protein n=1 Tax=Yinghuangia sp. ASG 101 TaxID=2896848 RepID=UPI001E5BCE24|nr:hypothetical protein [Yinghuangia sp. ASG 101]UGQ13609.1 hypothetical protein LO772_08405 [Yinghuangia sp. ASG 101]
MPQPTATPEPPDPAHRLDVPVTVWLAPRTPDTTPRQHAPDSDAFALPSWALSRLAGVYASGSGRLRLWRPAADGPLALPRWADATAGIIVDLTNAPLPGDPRAVAVLHTAAETLPPGAWLFTVTASDPDTAEETCGPVVRAAGALGLAYIQHLIVVNGHADGDRIVPHPGNAPAPVSRTRRSVPAPGHAPVHTDLLVFRAPAPDTPSGAR